MRSWSVIAIVLWLALLGYTGIVMANHGPNLLPVFFGDMAQLGWPGQFNFDFMLMLFVSASWTAWRSGFGAKGLAMGMAAFFLGASFLLVYLVYLIRCHGGDMNAVLLGAHDKGHRQ